MSKSTKNKKLSDIQNLLKDIISKEQMNVEALQKAVKDVEASGHENKGAKA